MPWITIWSIGDTSENGVQVEVTRDYENKIDDLLKESTAVIFGKSGANKRGRSFPVRNIASVRYDSN